jgi:hypothetical protein
MAEPRTNNGSNNNMKKKRVHQFDRFVFFLKDPVDDCVAKKNTKREQ